MLAIENCLPSCKLQSPTNLELITVSIYLKTAITCCMVYVPPNASIEYHAELVSYLSNITSPPTPVFIFGDLNYNMPDVNWSTFTGSLATSNRFCDMVFNSKLINSPTHNCGNVLDLALTDNAENIIDLIVYPPEYQCIPSDHYLIIFKTSSEHNTTQSTIAKGDFDSLNHYFLNCNYSSVYTCTNADEIWGLLKHYIVIGMNLFIPTVRLRARQFPAWFTPQLCHLLKCYCTRKCKYNKHLTPNNLQQLVWAHCSFHDANVASKSAYENNLINGYATRNDPKIFQYIKKFTKSDALPTQLHDDFDLADTDYSKAELLNKYFFSVFTKINCLEPNPDELHSIDNSLDEIYLTVSEVFQALIKLNPNNAGGIDNITPTVLRNFASALVVPLHYLFTISLNNGTIPTEWKTHKIIPIYKSGDNNVSQKLSSDITPV